MDSDRETDKDRHQSSFLPVVVPNIMVWDVEV